MRIFRKSLALVLALILAFSLACVPSLAYGRDVYNINKYVAFGDSVASGMNNEVRPPNVPVQTGTDDDGNPVYSAVEVLGTTKFGYISRVADAIGLSIDEGGGAISWSHTGMRVRDILHEIKANTVDYTGDEAYVYTFKINGFDAYRETIRKDIREADLITLNVGSNDIFTDPATYAAVEYAAQQAEEAANPKPTGSGSLALSIPNLSMSKPQATDEAGGSTLFQALLSPEYSGYLKILLPKMFEGFESFKKTYPVLLQELRDLNPTAQIITIGVFNPMHSMSLTGNSLITLGEIVDSVLLPMNSYIARTSAKYGCTYIDVVDVETDSSVHPTMAGYEEMKDRIVAKIRPITEFKDIALQSPEFQKAIQWAVNIGVTVGTGEGTFSPNRICNRAEILSYLWRLAGEPRVESTTDFADVKADDYFADAVAWAVETGITKGTTAFTFSPYAPCTRAQIVTFLYRYDQATNPDAEDAGAFAGFRDVGVGAYFGAPVSWAVKTGITKGISSVVFGPMEPCTRAQAVTFLARYVGA